MRPFTSRLPIACWPAIEMLPLSGSRRPHTIFMVVVLPAPFGPSRPYTSPSAIRKPTPSTARRVPKLLVRPAHSRTGGWLTRPEPAGVAPPGPAAEVTPSAPDHGRHAEPRQHSGPRADLAPLVDQEVDPGECCGRHPDKTAADQESYGFRTGGLMTDDHEQPRGLWLSADLDRKSVG